MNTKPIIIASLIAVLFVMIVYFSGRLVFESGSDPDLSATADKTDTTRERTPPTKTIHTPVKDKLETKTEKPNSMPRRKPKSLEDLIAAMSPEERRRWDEIREQGRAELEKEEAFRRANPTPEEIESARISEEVRKYLKEAEAEAIEDAKIDAKVEERLRGIEKRRAERERVLEEARQFQAEFNDYLEDFKELIADLKRRGLWDHEKNQPITTPLAR